MKKILLTVMICSLAMASNPTGFVTKTALGYVQTQGNTDTKTFNLSENAKKDWKKHSLKFSLDGQYAIDRGVTSKNKYRTELQYGYKYKSILSYTYLIGYISDKFSSFNSQFYTGPGIKYKVLKTKTQKLNLEGSVLYARDSIKADNTVNNYGSYRAKGIYSWQIFKNLKFNQEISYRSELGDSANYFIYSKSLLSSKLSDMFEVGLSYIADYVNKPTNNIINLDKTLTINLIINY